MDFQMKKIFFCSIVIAVLSSYARMVLPLASDGSSSVTVYLPKEVDRPTAAVVVCPGGGYRMLCDTYEGHDMAKWLNARGIAGIVLHYRLTPKYHKDEMLADGYAALKLVRDHAAEWKIDPKRVGALGFSAGGHLASMLGVLPNVNRADFMALVYPHTSMRRGLGHEHMREAFLGPGYTEADAEKYSAELQVTGETPSAFVAHARTDKVCDVAFSRTFVEAMRTAGRPVSYTELPKGAHGLGAGKGEDWAAWLAAFETWLKESKLSVGPVRTSTGILHQNLLFHNVDYLEPSTNGLMLIHRAPDSVDQVMGAQGKRMNRSNTGVEVRFVMKGDAVKLRFGGLSDETMAQILVYYGDFIADWPETSKYVCGRDGTIVIRRSPRLGKMKTVAAQHGRRFDPEVVRLVLPHGRLGFKSVEGEVEPPKSTQMPGKIYLAYGSSITHGSIGCLMPFNYASLVGERLGTDVRNLGFAGSALMEREMADFISEQDFDYISLEMGINGLAIPPEEYERRVRHFVAAVADSHPEARVLAIDVFRFVGDERGQFRAARFREILARVVKELARPNVVYVNGLDALPKDNLLSEGFVHPSPAGHRAIADHLLTLWGNP